MTSVPTDHGKDSGASFSGQGPEWGMDISDARDEGVVMARVEGVGHLPVP